MASHGGWHRIWHGTLPRSAETGYTAPHRLRAVPLPIQCFDSSLVDPREMITFFQVNGAMIYVDPDGNVTGFDDVFTRIAKCRAHYATCGLGSEYIDQFIR